MIHSLTTLQELFLGRSPLFQAEMHKYVCLRILQCLPVKNRQQQIQYLKTGDLAGYLNLDVDPLVYTDAFKYLVDAQAKALLSKCTLLGKSDTAKATTLKKWYSAEAKCKETNQKFAYLRLSTDLHKHSVYGGDFAVLHEAKKYCQMVASSYKIGEPDFGPGSTFDWRGKDSNIVSKLRAVPSFSSSCYDLGMRILLDRMPYYALSSGIVKIHENNISLNLDIVKEKVVKCAISEFFTVDKKFLEDRGCGLELSGNCLIQKAIGDGLRSAHKQVSGLNLNFTPAKHKVIAQKASISGLHATLDQRSASDLVAVELVKYLFEGTELLDQMLQSRSTHMTVEGVTHRLEKFSSMGNGFTFELESVVFYSILWACRNLYNRGRGTISVFGDDIICPTSIVEHVQEHLRLFGFDLNDEKSFWTGPFRETCGGDFFNGVFVRPVYLGRKKYDDDRAYLLSLANNVRLMAWRLNNAQGRYGCYNGLRNLWLEIITFGDLLQFSGPAIPNDKFAIFSESVTLVLDKRLVRVNDINNWVSMDLRFTDASADNGYGDTVLWTSLDERRAIHLGHGSYETTCLIPYGTRRVKPRGAWHELAAALYGISPVGVVPRGRLRYKRKKLVTPVWSNHISWML